MIPSSGQILVVDDSGALRMLLKRVLEKAFAGWKVKSLANGLEALGQPGSLETTSLLITDLEMPEGDGQGLVERWESDPGLRDKPLIVLSGGGFRDLDKAYGASPKVRFLEKPCAAGEIVRTARQLLEQDGENGTGMDTDER